MPYCKKQSQLDYTTDLFEFQDRLITHWQHIINTMIGGRYDTGDKATIEPAHTIFRMKTDKMADKRKGVEKGIS
jgi:hypothetical protein